MSQVQTVIQWLRQRLRTIRAGVPALAALAVLVLVGAVVALAAPGASPLRRQTAQATATQGLSQRPGASAKGAAGSPSPTATATSGPRTHQNVIDPTPTATPTLPPPDPTATATPAPPAPTATPAPSWHTLGSWSGAGAGQFATVSNLHGNVELRYTCDASAGNWEVEFAMTEVGNPSNITAGRSGCNDAGGASGSGTLAFTPDTPGLSWNLALVDVGGGSGPWTATLVAWY